ncbi:RICIN domain-containing protein [Lentzea sp. NPDC092896]|uniref:RICIN domain-containing protein n=1 Tax=Lentzea sp. NPDC092896 TaxID=3364127 RepID=UPI0037F3D326
MGMKLLSVALAAIALGAVMVAPASATTGNNIVEIRSMAYGECLQAGTEPHDTQIVACTGAEEQRWEVVLVDGNRHLLRNLANRECLSETFGFYWCDDELAHGFAVSMPDAPGAVRIRFGDGEAYLTALTWQNGERDVLIQSPTDRAEQRWLVRTVGMTQPLPDTSGQVVRIRAADGARFGCISLTGSSLVPAPCTDSPAQKFQRIEAAGGRTALRSVANGKCVAVASAQAVVPEVVSDCVPGEVLQQWSIEPTKLGSARLRQVAADKFLTPGTGWMFLTTHWSDTWQQWELQPA